MDTPSCKERLSRRKSMRCGNTARWETGIKTGVVCKSRATRIWWFFEMRADGLKGPWRIFGCARSPVDDGEW